MTSRDEKMQVIIDLAKEQVINWYNPITNREWISQSIGNNIPKFSNRPEERTEMYVLTGGEAKGFVVAFHGLGKVIAYDMYATRTREYSIQDNQKTCQNLQKTANLS